jgi:hypothetical protein
MRIGRRAILQRGSLWLGAWPSSLAATGAPAVRFGVVTDVHHADKPEARTRYYRESLGKLREAVSKFRSERVAFAVELGDLVDAAADLETEQRWLREAGQELRKSGAGTHYVLGNHCVQTLTKRQFLTTVTRDASYYCFDNGGVRFVVLDACFRKDGVSYDAGNFNWTDSDIPEGERDWLRDTLDSAPGKAVVFVHQRLDVPGVHSVAGAAAVRAILERSGKVLAVFQGHSHANDYREVGGIHYCTMRAVVEGSGQASSGYGIVSVFGDGRVQVDGFRAQTRYQWRV